MSEAARLRLDDPVCQVLQRLIVCPRFDEIYAEEGGEADTGREQTARGRVGDSLASQVDRRGRPTEVLQLRGQVVVEQRNLSALAGAGGQLEGRPHVVETTLSAELGAHITQEAERARRDRQPELGGSG